MKLDALNPDQGSDTVAMGYICFSMLFLYVKIALGAKPYFGQFNG